MTRDIEYFTYPVNRKSECINSDRQQDIVGTMNGGLTFREALIKALASEGAPSLRQVCLEAGVSYQQMSKLKLGHASSTNAEDAVKVANVFGVTLDEFLQADPDTAPHSVSLIYNRLPGPLRDKLRTYGQGLLDGVDNRTAEAPEAAE